MRLALVGVLLNTLLAVTKIAAGILGNTYALIADGIESTLDIFASLIIWGGLQIATLPPDDSHPYGHGKAEALATIVVALTVLAAAVGLAVQSLREIYTPHHAPAPFTLVVLLVVIVCKELLFRKVIRAGNEIGSTAVQADAWHHRADAITSVAALIGISIALIGGPGYEPADDWAALLACGIIAYNGYRLLMPAIYEVMDTAPPSHLAEQVREVAAGVPGVVGLERCLTRKMGLQYYVDMHVEVDADITVREGHLIAHAVKDTVQGAIPTVADVLVHVEPAGEMDPRL